MNDWRNGPASLPQAAVVGPTVAGIGPRLGAWLIDWLIFVLIGVGFILAGVAVGSVTENPEATRQLLADPAAQPTVPLLSASLHQVMILAGAWVAAVVVYPAFCWSSFRSLPGQRMASLEVADETTGVNLSPLRALLRSLALNGLPAAALAVMVVASVDTMATLPTSSYGGDSWELSRLMTDRWGALPSLASMTLWLWLPILLVSAAATFRRRGLHDRAGRSVVVRMPRLPYPWPGTAGPPPYNASWAPGLPPVPYPPPTAPPTAPPAEGEARPGWLPVDKPDPAARRTGEVVGSAILRRRVTAYLLDGLLVYGVYGLVRAVVAGPAVDEAPISGRDLVIVALGAGAAQCAYFVAAWSLVRGTLAQRAMGLLVVRDTGERLGLLDAVARWAVLQGPLALVAVVPADVIGPLVIAVWAAVLLSSVRTDERGRGYHDRIAGSKVILQGSGGVL